jgi:hypothetical protein
MTATRYYSLTVQVIAVSHLLASPGISTLADLLGEQDPRLKHMLGMHAVVAHWVELPRREQEILLTDFRGGLTQRDRPTARYLPDAWLRLRTRALA